MQAHCEGFAYVYNMRWASFVWQMAPLILNFYPVTLVGQAKKSFLESLPWNRAGVFLL